MRQFRLLMVGLFVLAWIAGPIQGGFAQDDVVVSEEKLAQFEAIFQSEMEYQHIPGAAVAVIQDGTVIYSQGFGVRNVATGEPFTPQTQFRIGSTTKSMTSLVIAQMVDEGLLNWDTPVTEIYPDFQTSDPALTARLTVRDLMSMGTGLESDDMRSLGWGEWTEDDIFATVAAMSIGGEYRQYYAYNNEVYASAAYVAAMAAGDPPTLDAYKQRMQTRLFDPVGMSSTLITDDKNLLSANVSESYSFSLLGSVAEPDPVPDAPIHVVAPAGGVWSTLDDMARYLITQMNGGVTPDGTRIVSADNLAATWEPQVDMPTEEPEIERLAYAMGWVEETYNGIPFRFHDGGWDGYRTQMVIFPETQTGLLIFCNHIFGDVFNQGLTYAFADILNGNDPAPLLDEIHTAFERNYGSLDAQLALLPPPEVNPEDVAPLLGSYEEGWAVELRDDNRLRITRPNWEFTLRPMPGDNLYMIASGAAMGVTVQFAQDGDQVTLSLEFEGEIWTFAKTG